MCLEHSLSLRWSKPRINPFRFQFNGSILPYISWITLTKCVREKEEWKKDTYTQSSIDRKEEPRWDNFTDHSLKIAQAGPVVSLFHVNVTVEDKPIHVCTRQQLFMLPHKRGLPGDFQCMCVLPKINCIYTNQINSAPFSLFFLNWLKKSKRQNFTHSSLCLILSVSWLFAHVSRFYKAPSRWTVPHSTPTLF